MLAGPHKVLVEDWINLMIEARNMGMTKEEVLRFLASQESPGVSAGAP
ncbi:MULTISPECIES: anti-repressor SinI family protein [Paenibacillus]|nr:MULTISPECIES: anti-repressor SinI family protein [Paenibacillus]